MYHFQAYTYYIYAFHDFKSKIAFSFMAWSFMLLNSLLQLLREVGEANQGSADSGIGTNLGIDVCDNRSFIEWNIFWMNWALVYTYSLVHEPGWQSENHQISPTELLMDIFRSIAAPSHWDTLSDKDSASLQAQSVAASQVQQASKYFPNIYQIFSKYLSNIFQIFI